MDIGNFNDFLDSITQETVEQIANDANIKAQQTRGDMSPNDPRFIGTQVGALSFTISLELLGLYHKWLEQQL